MPDPAFDFRKRMSGTAAHEPPQSPTETLESYTSGGGDEGRVRFPETRVTREERPTLPLTTLFQRHS